MTNKQTGNGLGSNKVKPWSPTSIGDYKRGLQAPKTGNIPSEHRPGAGAKQ